MSLVRCFSCGLLVVAVAGCSSSPRPVEVHTVSGRIVYDSKPAAGVQVFLFPMSAPTVPQIPSNPRGVTGDDGRFHISTYQEGDGAPEGTYRVVLYWPGKAEPGEEWDSDRLMGWYDAAHTKFEVEIRAGDNSLPTFSLPAVSSPPPPSQGVPGRN